MPKQFWRGIKGIESGEEGSSKDDEDKLYHTDDVEENYRDVDMDQNIFHWLHQFFENT